MSQRLGDKREMPDVPKLDFVGALAEIWFQINYAAYHMAYVRVYSQSDALRTNADVLRDQEQVTRDQAQVDVVICRTHLAAFFWHLEHVFEALRTAITRGQKELPELKYFWAYEKRLDEIEQFAVRQEIRDYRNMGHQNPAIIGSKWNGKDTSFITFFRRSAATSRRKTSKSTLGFSNTLSSPPTYGLSLHRETTRRSSRGISGFP